MRTKAGRVFDRLGMEHVDGIRGIVALEDVEKGRELMYCPWDLVIGSFTTRRRTSLTTRKTSEPVSQDSRRRDAALTGRP